MINSNNSLLFYYQIDKTEFVDLIVKWLERDLFKAKEEFL